MDSPLRRPSLSTVEEMTKRWFAEKDPFSPINYRYAIDRVLHTRRSAVQEIKVLEHSFFGKMLVLDDVIQLTERDEPFYHEMLAHVPLHSHPGPETVLVIGGGDGGTLREALRHPTVRQVTLVEIDPEVTAVSQEFFPSLACSFSSPKVITLAADGADYLAAAKERFDVILVDAPDPVGPARSLSTPEFFAAASNALTDQGVFAMQTESLHFHVEFVSRVQEQLRQVFPWVGLYSVPLATYAGNWWSFSMAARVPLTAGPVRPSLPDTLYYSAEVHNSSFISTEALGRLLRHHLEFDARMAGAPGRKD